MSEVEAEISCDTQLCFLAKLKTWIERQKFYKSWSFADTSVNQGGGLRGYSPPLLDFDLHLGGYSPLRGYSPVLMWRTKNLYFV